jgi:signal peptidase I
VTRAKSERLNNPSTPVSSGDKTSPQAHSSQATRETFESVVIAVILAFLFRGFVAEAFVIPTGSMAPTLQGRHIDPQCPECGYDYRTGASEENDVGRGIVVGTFCPMCRFPLDLLPRETVRQAKNVGDPRVQNQLSLMRSPNLRSFNGDRILVSKFAYEFSDPERWDVIVFKYPGNAKQNYIKRLVGLPNELIRIRHGNIYVADLLFSADVGMHGNNIHLGSIAEGLLESSEVNSALREQFVQNGISLSDNCRLEIIDPQGYPFLDRSQAVDIAWHLIDEEMNRQYLLRVPDSMESTRIMQVFTEFRIARKPPNRQLALMQAVHDTAYLSPTLTELGWPSRWQDRGSAEPRWEILPEGEFAVEAEAETAWLRYRNIAPTDQDWEIMLATDTLPDPIAHQDGSLISDYYAYNDRVALPPGHGRDRQLGSHWVSDLAVEADVQIEAIDAENAATLTLDLVAGGIHFFCELDLATGRARLSRSDEEPFVGVDGMESLAPEAETPVRGPGRYHLRFANVDDQLRLWVNRRLIEFMDPTTYRSNENLVPRWSEDDPGDLAPLAIGARHARVHVHRLSVWRDVYYLAIHAYSGMNDYRQSFSEVQIQELFRSPQRWPLTDLFASRRVVEFSMDSDHFFPLGDNSPQSQDGRRWEGEPYFERDLLIGKALFIYWPHAWRRPIPFLPNFSRMSFIR